MELRQIGQRLWFEYHCNESEESPDAPIWHRTHQEVTVIGPAMLEDTEFTEFTEYSTVPKTRKERAEEAVVLTYKVRFDDCLEWDVFEDELLDHPSDFECKDYV